MRLFLFSALLSVSVLLAACGGGTAATPATSAPASSAPKASEPAKPAAAAPAQSSAAAPAKVDPLTIKFAHTGSETHAITVGSKIWKPKLDELSGGAIKVQEYPNSQLGGERELEEGARLGTIDMIAVAADGALPGFVPVMQVMGLPYLFRDQDHVYKMAASPVGKELEKALADGGFTTLGWWELGFRNMTTKGKAINSADDMKGLKMRVQESNVWLAFMKSLGAIPTPIPFNELYTALQQGVVDGQENPISTIYAMKYYEVQKQVALTQHVYTAELVLVNKKWWDGLKPEQRQVIQASMDYTTPLQRKALTEQDEEKIKFLKEQGVNVTTPDKKAFMELTKDVPKTVADKVPAELVQKIRDIK